jgi:hypothetical protein
MVWIAKIKE